MTGKNKELIQTEASSSTASIEFYLFAPTVRWAALVGEFNGWQDSELVKGKGEDGVFGLM